MAAGHGVELRHYLGGEFGAVRDFAVALYCDVFEGETGEPFWSVERYKQRLERHATMPGFGAVVARLDGGDVGFAYGLTLPAETYWWKTIRPPLADPAFTHEDGRRTFALFEVIVRPALQGHGIGRRIHDELLTGRSEQRVTIATRRENDLARTIYTKWGYRHVGTRQPEQPAPLLDVFIRSRVRSEDASV